MLFQVLEARGKDLLFLRQGPQNQHFDSILLIHAANRQDLVALVYLVHFFQKVLAAVEIFIGAHALPQLRLVDELNPVNAFWWAPNIHLHITAVSADGDIVADWSDNVLLLHKLVRNIEINKLSETQRRKNWEEEEEIEKKNEIMWAATLVG